jgi:putative ABC transport system ATP-binding protein
VAPVIRAEGLEMEYFRSGPTVRALRGVDLSVEAGEFLFLVGPSGSGKSTLMHCLGALEEPSAGRVLYEDRDLSEMNDAERSVFRRQQIGFIFQAFNLIATLTALENVLLPILPEGVPPSARDRARALLVEVGLGDRVDHRPGELSGGEQQRVAVARSFLNRPRVILADEPTGELDSRSGGEVIETMRRMNRETGTTIVVVTHNEALLVPGDRVVRMRDGVVIDDSAGNR